MRIVVVGGGLFGSTAAIHLSHAGHDVHLYERNSIMGAASACSQARLHEGFHYPRSPETIAECQAAIASFRTEYGDAIIDTGRHYYAIAKEGSKVSGIDYVAFCMRHGLSFSSGFDPVVLDCNAIDVALSVDEGRLDLHRLREMVVRRLDETGVTLHCEPATRSMRSRFDAIVIATYAATNQVASELGAKVEPFQFEVVEKPVVRMPEHFRDVGIVIMDGEFCCIDPWGRTGLHVMGHVKHAIHHANVGLEPEIPGHLKHYLNCDLVVNPAHTRFQDFIAAGMKFIPDLRYAEWLGSMWTVRAVLPNRDADDARPTLVSLIGENTVRIFSGKMGTAVTAAREAVSMLGVEKREAA